MWKNNIEEVYYEVIKKMFGETKANEINNLVKIEEEKNRLGDIIENLKHEILNSEKEAESLKRTIELLRDFKGSEEGRIIGELCSGNVALFRKLKKLINENNRFGIDTSYTDDYDPKLTKGFHVRVLDFENGNHAYTTFIYGTGVYDIDNDIKLMKEYLKDSEKEREDYKTDLSKYTKELEALRAQ